MPAGRPGRLIAAGSGLCLTLAACSTGTGRAAPEGPSAPATPASPLPAAATPRPSAPATAMQITPAPYQLPSPIAREVALARGGDLLIAGGLTQRSATTGAMFLLDPVTGQVRRAGRLARPTQDAAGALVSGQPYVFGGAAVASVADVQALSPPGTAATAGQLPEPRSGASAVTLGGTAYLIGGYDGASLETRVLATTDGRRFATVATLPVPVRYPAVAGAGKTIWVFGGQTPSAPTDAVQRINLATGRAAVVGHLPDPTSGAVAFTLGGRVYLAGGQVQRGRARGGRPGASGPRLVTSNGVFAFDPTHDAVAAAGQLPVPVANAAVAVLAGTAYLIGGDGGQRQVPTVTRLRLTAASAAGGAAGGGPVLASAPWLGPAHGPGHLAPHSDPSALPGDILIADNWNNRLLIVDPQGRIRWEFPRPGDLRRGQSFLLPDDAFFSPDGRDIIATEEEDSVISVIDIARRKIVYRYGTPGVPGSAINHVANPDDAMMMPGGWPTPPTPTRSTRAGTSRPTTQPRARWWSSTRAGACCGGSAASTIRRWPCPCRTATSS
jgi:hypothetical protein